MDCDDGDGDENADDVDCAAGDDSTGTGRRGGSNAS
jgi:hypothetical protein